MLNGKKKYCVGGGELKIYFTKLVYLFLSLSHIFEY